MDRASFRARLEANAVRPEQRIVQLPACGDQVTLQRPNKAQLGRAAAAAGVDDDAPFAAMVNVLRWALIDESDGQPLAGSYAEAAAWLNGLDGEDIAAVFEALAELIDDDTDTDGEDPKGS